MWGIVTLTRNGLLVAKSVRNHFPDSVVYTLPKWSEVDTHPIDTDFGEFVRSLFSKYDTLVFIMATGIVVRSLAPLLQSKTTDPAVLVMDEKGEFVISLLSGHLGGANDIAHQIASKIGAKPVITTSSDVNGLVSVDMIAKKHNLLIDSMKDAKTITAMLVNGQNVAQINETESEISHYYTAEAKNAEGLLIISNKAQIIENRPFAQLIPQNITIGIGCRKGIAADDIIYFIENQLFRNNIHSKSIKCFATIDIKKNEAGILAAAKHFGVELKIIDSQDIAKVEHLFDGSDFVKSQIGVSCVCEPAAYLACNRKGKFKVFKQSHEGITLAIFEEECI